MRIVHTSDWHAGRVWKGVDRLPELEAVLDHLAGYIEAERVDVVLVTGDLFDTGAPPAKAERVVFRFLKRVGQAGARTVVIAGNHDSGARIEAWGALAELVGVHALGRPQPANRGGVVEIEVARTGERAVVALLPFAAPRTLVTAFELTDDDTAAMQTYADKVRAIVRRLTASFRADTVNLLCAHTHLDGARFDGTERKVHLGEQWAATPQALPADAHYVALGHIHVPQQVPAPSPAYYAGSPLQLDFGERGQDKSFVVVDAAPGSPAQIQRVPYQGGRPLRVVEGTPDEIEAQADTLRDAGWLQIRLSLDRPQPEVNRRIRALFDNVVSVQAVLPASDAVEPPAPPIDGAPLGLYAAYYAQAHGAAPEPALLERLERLLASHPQEEAP